MTPTIRLERAIERCYESILRPQGWTKALDELSAALGGNGCFLLEHDRTNRTLACMGSSYMEH